MERTKKIYFKNIKDSNPIKYNTISFYEYPHVKEVNTNEAMAEIKKRKTKVCCRFVDRKRGDGFY